MSRPWNVPEEFVASLTPQDFDSEDMRMLARRIGVENAVKLIFACGGISLYLNGGSDGGNGSGWAVLVDRVGRDLAEEVRDALRGEILYVAEFGLWNAYNNWIKRNYCGDPKRMALRCGVSECYVYSVLNRQGREPQTKQRTLF